MINENRVGLPLNPWAVIAPAILIALLTIGTLLLSGKMLTGRDAAHKRIADMLAKGEKLPVDFTNRVIYYVGPVDPVRDEAVGPAGPTTSTRTALWRT